MRILFLGTPEFAVPSLRAIREAGLDVGLVVTRPDARSGRGRRQAPPPVKKAASAMGLPVYQPASVNSERAAGRLRAVGAHLGVVVAYGEILARRTLSVTAGGFINLHASLLPKYRGAAPINWALICGERRTGVTVQRMSPELDAGPILAQRVVAIGEDDSAGVLHDRLAQVGAQALVEVLLTLAGGEPVPETPQRGEDASYAPKLGRADSRVDWEQSAQQIANRVRGLTPWPGATTCFVGANRAENVTLLRVMAKPQARRLASPGTVTAVSDEEGISVQSGNGTVIIRELKPASGRAMAAADYAHGRHVRVGDRFE